MGTITLNVITVLAESALKDNLTSDEFAAILAHDFDVPADTIADDVAEIFERLTIAADLAEDPEHALFIHYDETYHGGDMTALREHELDAARQAAERIAGKVTPQSLDEIAATRPLTVRDLVTDQLGWRS